jgi:hypothetical protein
VYLILDFCRKFPKAGSAQDTVEDGLYNEENISEFGMFMFA